MRKIIKALCFAVIVFCSVLMGTVVYGFYALPDNIHTMSGGDIDVGFYTCSLPDKGATEGYKSVATVGEYKLNISLFNKIPVKISNLTVSDRKYVVPSGDIIGLRLFTKGVMIVAVDSVDTHYGYVNPSKQAKLQTGDVITVLNGCEIESSSQVEKIISSCEGNSISVEYIRNNVTYETSITPVYSASEAKFKTGLWIRDSAAGIGTMTFYEKNTGLFAGLGHAVCDIDTGEVLPLSNGDIVSAAISGCVKGKSGTAGELCGSFRNQSLGTLFLNDEFGVFGYLTDTDNAAEEIPVALKNEIKVGSAKIISTVDETGKAYYDVEIEKINPDDKNGKNMIIKITDIELIGKTGGIVQGMSGSPVIQDGKLVGAVTHVFLNDPTRGYAISAETMLNKVDNSNLKNVS